MTRWRLRGVQRQLAAGVGLLLLVAGAGCGGTHRQSIRATALPEVSAPAPSEQVSNSHRLEGYAVVYVRRQSHRPDGTDSFQAVWQLGDPDDARVVYETGRWADRDTTNGPAFPPPVGCGILPSPDGHWLHVWESVYHGEGGSFKTVWTVVEVPTGRRLTIGELPRDKFGYFPYWLDAHRLSLEKGDERTVFDVGTGQLTRPLSAPRQQPYPYGSRDIDGKTDAPVAVWRQQYISRHYARELGALGSALATFGRELGISDVPSRRRWPRTARHSCGPPAPPLGSGGMG